MPRLRVQIGGRVQGVGFRFATYRQAQSLELTGWVRNRVDGSVEAEFEGPRTSLEAMLAWCNEGPAFARVDGVVEEWLEEGAGYHDFEIW